MLIVGVIGLGYVGLPLSVASAEKARTIGFDLNQSRIIELKNSYDSNLDISQATLKNSKNLIFSDDEEMLREVNVYIITVPTPVYPDKKPDLRNLISACSTVAKYLQKNDIIIIESTVYPGVTEEVCVPIFEKISKLKLNMDFGVGYSPERINPGDKIYSLKNVTKVISGSNRFYRKQISDFYNNIIGVKVFEADSIKVAESAKIIENVQRDINIALINEFTIILSKLGLNIFDVLSAANTKWNFLNFKPGLVGGHCIGVDPYYLAHKAIEIGITPTITLSGRTINEKMAQFYVSDFLAQIKNKSPRILILGYTFKENVPDIRNTKIEDVVKLLHSKVKSVHVVDPFVKPESIKNPRCEFIDYNDFFDSRSKINKKFNSYFDGIFFSVPHEKFKPLIKSLHLLLNADGVVYDVKGVLPRNKPRVS
jgi:UDP-N-acetyl-D-galactosamine dehydrogenase